MKRIHSLLLIVFLLVPFMASSNPAYAMHISEMETIVANSRSAVDTALAQLQSALTTGDRQIVQLAQNALDLSIENYAIASDSLAKAQAGDTVSDSTMEACNDVADGVGNVCNLLAAGNLSDAQAAYDTAYSTLPPSSHEGEIPSGLADIKSQILAASSDSATIIAGGGTTGTSESLGTSNASPI